jgi:septal ring factor EnvC (AmiA/AmiB activator)
MPKFILAVFVLFQMVPLLAADLHSVKSEHENVSNQIKNNEKVNNKTRKELVKSAEIISKLEYEKAAVEEKISMLEKEKSGLLKQISQNSKNLSDAAAALMASSQLGTSFDEKDSENYVLTGAILQTVSKQFDQDMQIAGEKIKELEKIQIALEKQHGLFEAAQKRHQKEQTELDNLLRARSEQNRELRGRQYELQTKLNRLSAESKNVSELAVKIVPQPTARAGRGGKMRFPSSGMLLLRFGQYDASGLKSDGWRARTRANAIVMAPADGKIAFADYFRKNYVVIIEHDNGYLSVMTGMSGINVLIGQNVLGGEPIGRMPSTPSDIYVELRRGENAIDPARMFSEPR